MLTAVFGTVKRLLLQDDTPNKLTQTTDDPDSSGGKTVKPSLTSLYDNLEYGQNFKDSDEEDVVTKETKSFRGKVTDLLYGYGLIDNDVYFTFDCVCGGERPDVDSRVDVVAERDHNKGGWKAKDVRLVKSSDWDEDDEAGDGPHELIGTITKVTQDSGLINDMIVFDQDSLVYGFKPHRGDWVQGETVTDSEHQTVARSIRPLREDKFRGTVTHAFPGYGHVNGRIYFSFKVCEGGWRPKKGDMVEGKAIESKQSKGNWRAIFMKQDTRTNKLNRLETANNSPFRKFLEEDLKSNKGGIEITDDLGLGTTLIGNTKSTVASIRNVGKDSKTLTSYEVCCPTGEVTIALSAVSCSGSPRQPETNKHHRTQSASENVSTLPVTLPPQAVLSVTVSIKAKQLGRCLCQLTFHFGEFSIGRLCTVNAQDSQMMRLMPEGSVSPRGSKFNTKRREKRELTIDGEFGGYFFPGVRPERNFDFNVPVKLPHYPVPRDLKACVLDNGDVTKVAPRLMQSLSLENFSRRFSALLHLEEIRMEQDMREFDLEKVSMRPRKEFLSLEVPGLAEGRPSVLTGDKIIVTHPNRNHYEGFVHEVYGEAVLLKFHPSFHDLYQAEECSVIFTFSRTSLRRCHQACEFAKKLGNQVIFPTTVEAKPPQVSVTFRSQADKPHKIPVRVKPSAIIRLPGPQKPLSSNEPLSKPPTVIGRRKTETQRFTNKKGSLGKTSEEDVKFITPRIQDMKVSHVAMDGKEMAEFHNPRLNVRQQSAVIRILQGEGRPMPYIIFGPPGTGKTVTVVEAILQVHFRRPSSRILACTPSNSAADLLTERIHDSNKVDPGAMVRLNAFHRSQESIPSVILPYCKDGEKLEFISYQRIIVCTCSTAGSLYQRGLSAGHFSHVFVDEAGQATEPECLVPVGLSVGPEGQIILAGDPMQLGPVLNSHIAKEYGLGQSFLERLILRKVYRRDADKYRDHGCYDPLLVTKLVENYRSHPSLLKLPSKLFYHDELLPMADTKLTHQLAAWEKLPNKNGNCPLLFHGVLGEDMRDGNSPSWFNPAEVVQVINYIQGLLASTSPVIGPDDIGVITPYRKQVEKIRMMLTSLALSGIKVGSVEEFQGQERIAMIISTVRSSENLLNFDVRHHLGFLSNPKRFNVAITRAQALMVIVGNPNVLAKDKHWRALLNYCLELGAYTGTQPPALTQDSYDDVESLDGSQEPGNSSPRQQDSEAVTMDERLPTAPDSLVSNHNTENQCERVPTITDGSDPSETLKMEQSALNGRSENHSKKVLVPLHKVNGRHQEQSCSPQKLNSSRTDSLKTNTVNAEAPCDISQKVPPANEKPSVVANEKPSLVPNDSSPSTANENPPFSAYGNVLYNPENYLTSKTETTRLSQVPASHHDQVDLEWNSAADSHSGCPETALSTKDGATECLSKCAPTHPASQSEAGSLVTLPNRDDVEKSNHIAERIKSASSNEQNLKSWDEVEEVCFAREIAKVVESSLKVEFGQCSPPNDLDSYSKDHFTDANFITSPVHEQAPLNDTQLSPLRGGFTESDVSPATLASALRILQTFQEKGYVENFIPDDSCLEYSGEIAPPQQDAGQVEDEDEEEIWDEEVDLSEIYQRGIQGGATPQDKLKEQWDGYSEDGGQRLDFSPTEQNPTSQEKCEDEISLRGASHPHQEPGEQQLAGKDFVEDDPEMPSLEEWFQDLKTDTSALPTNQRYPEDNRETAVDQTARAYLANRSVPHEATGGLGGYINMNQRATPPGLGRGTLSSKSERRSSSRPRHSGRSHMIGAPTYNNPPRPNPRTCPHHTHDSMIHQREANNEVMNSPHNGVYTDYDLRTTECAHHDSNLNPEEVKGQSGAMPPQETSQEKEEWVGSENHFFYRKPVIQHQEGGAAFSRNTYSWEETMRGYQTRYTTEEDFMGGYQPPAAPVYHDFPGGGGYTGPDGSSYPVAANLETMDQYDVIIESSCDESSDNQDRAGPQPTYGS